MNGGFVADVLKEQWEVLDGNIATVKEFDYQAKYGLNYKSKAFIAFNVGRTIAQYIVNLHNAQLKE